ncbi:hypothetical protein BIY24_11595 [Halobacteriovorax marinus]|uniref:Lipoprotein n=1 Tax=Halobacteriovorax marinus (strain ATCC BAA-682 / DSM 15412 / SJ) TaxID=862908 RepID=E1X5E6_HALMS|nr:hypothetical protein [Halobacteriovorax marinus]ATH08568.1 hypothetical protein BIY24_11595 [Halobacteriovorax marinus]CBW27267.1 hypothetical protein BMS_2475 [Halobacteriovorax marinus SJ]
MKALVLLTLLSMTNVFADECRNSVMYQSMDILSYELGVPYDEVEGEYQITLTKTSDFVDGIEKYEALYNTYSGVYLMKMDVNYFCDITSSQTFLK